MKAAFEIARRSMSGPEGSSCLMVELRSITIQMSPAAAKETCQGENIYIQYLGVTSQVARRFDSGDQRS